ncbi:MAG TPA: helix-turn-helix domain-containing protein [Enteractinococcus helveticum]|uniref:Helix-turn-helix domain-containing protein n=1 Tax=Enteractinococcus helveticum TaxID=1837282 RepID=A0A921FNR8_9MICC|nr:helix-turn-helix transcriptional regulator [Enteractinococcus helveticum]HJF15468.1 helix-turn-helix domain-containing protein [Enteractinococcus helveticum]
MRSQLEELLGIDPTDPLDQLADLLVSEDEKLLDQLVAIRKRTLSQAEVAQRMGISQGAVARIESGSRNPHLSTLRRYAHAVRARVEHRVSPFEGPVSAFIEPYANTFEKPFQPNLERSS